MAEKFSTPGFYREEIDLSEITSPVGTSTGALVIESDQGPVNRRVLITDDKSFVEVFGEPDGSTFGHYAALQYLQSSDRLYVVRATSGSGELYANTCVAAVASSASDTSAATITAGSSISSIAGAYADGFKSNDIKDIESVVLPGDAFMCISSIGPGSYGNNIGIRITTSADTPSVSGGNYDWANKYDDAPSTDNDPLYGKVFKIDVFIKDKKASTFASTLSPVETFYVTRTEQVDGNGRQLQVEKVINGKSKYIYVKNTNNVSAGLLPASVGQSTIVGLTTGANGGSVSAGNKQQAWTLFSDRNKSTVNILIVSDTPTTANKATQLAVGNIAATRQDCIAVIQANQNTYQTIPDLISSTQGSFNNPSYVAIYAGYSEIYDKFNDKFIQIPNAIFGASLMARTDAVANTWDAPAGLNRGSVAAQNQDRVFTDTEIGLLYDENINCIKKIEGIGFIMWGQKTAQKKATALDRINVRRLLLYIENTIEPDMLPFLFEGNTPQNRLRITTIIEEFLSTVQAGGGITKFKVKCDEENNTSDIIDANQILIDLYVQPTRVAEFIKLNTIITRSGVNFEEI